jgi:hypothetical protein
MVDFQDAYESWKNQPFPSGSSWDELDEVHADLALADTWVADTVGPFIESGVYRPAQVDVIGTLDKIRNRAIQLGAQGEGEDKRLAEEYAKYAGLLQSVYQGFLRESSL